MVDKKETKNKKPKTKSGGKKNLNPSALAVVDNIVFSKSEVWAYYFLSTDVFDFLSNDGKIRSSYQIANALTNLIGEKTEPIDAQIIITSAPVDIDAWAVQVKEISKDWKKSPGFEKFMNDQFNLLKSEEYLKKVIILGVKLSKRGALDFDGLNFLEIGLKEAKDRAINWMNTALSIPGSEISVKEEETARRKEEDIHRTLSTGNLEAERMTSEDILLTIKRQMYPMMPLPYLEVDHGARLGAGDMSIELTNAVENKYRWLKITQMVDGEEMEGYRACLSFSKFPKQQNFPGNFPFMYLPAKLGLPFTLYSRFTITPSEGMKKKLEGKRKEMVDEINNVSMSGQTSGAQGVISGGQPQDVSDAVYDMQTMNAMLTGDKTPWVKGSYRIVVETPDEETLKKYCSIVKQSYSDLDINVSWTSGDQAELFLEQMPGDRLRIKSFDQITNLAFLATSGFRNSNDVGDMIFEGTRG